MKTKKKGEEVVAEEAEETESHIMQKEAIGAWNSGKFKGGKEWK